MLLTVGHFPHGKRPNFHTEHVDLNFEGDIGTFSTTVIA